VINKTLQKQIYKTDFKNRQIKRKKTPGWEADVSLPFLKVYFPKNLRSASKIFKRVQLGINILRGRKIISIFKFFKQC